MDASICFLGLSGTLYKYGFLGTRISEAPIQEVCVGPGDGDIVSVRLCLRIAVLRRLLAHLGWPVRDLPPTLPDEFVYYSLGEAEFVSYVSS